jgi:predicted PurR-regulated permease PerM
MGDPPPEQPGGRFPILRRAALWAGFFALLYIAREFFFVAFLTFLLCHLTLSVVAWGLGKLPEGWRGGWTRVLLTLGVFVACPLILLGLGTLLAPRVIEQGQRLAGYLSHVTLESEAARLAEGLVAPRLFRQEYPDTEGKH